VDLPRGDAESLAWLDDSLEYVQAAGQSKIETLLWLLRSEVLEEMQDSWRTSYQGPRNLAGPPLLRAVQPRGWGEYNDGSGAASDERTASP